MWILASALFYIWDPLVRSTYPTCSWPKWKTAEMGVVLMGRAKKENGIIQGDKLYVISFRPSIYELATSSGNLRNSPTAERTWWKAVIWLKYTCNTLKLSFDIFKFHILRCLHHLILEPLPCAIWFPPFFRNSVSCQTSCNSKKSSHDTFVPACFSFISNISRNRIQEPQWTWSNLLQVLYRLPVLFGNATKKLGWSGHFGGKAPTCSYRVLIQH